jgi:soluble lytic murein transglycosylase
MIWALVTLLAVGGTVDPRLSIVTAQLSGDSQRALALTDDFLKSDPESGREIGLDYLRGDLLERIGRHREADRAFASAMNAARELAPHARYRLAQSQNRRGHPEVAAGLVAAVLADGPPPALVEPSARLLAEAVSRGGDCRLLRELSSWSLRGAARRLLEVTSVECGIAGDPPEESIDRLLRLLEETTTDEAARLASNRLHQNFSSRITSQRDLIHVGQTFHHQRQFDLALVYLERGLAASPDGTSDEALARDARYALARSRFWRAEYLAAVSEFGRVAETAAHPDEAAGALYQQGRSYELDGAWEAAASSFRQAYLADSNGQWSAAALLSVMRLEWMHGNEDEALATLNVLGSRRGWSEMYGQAALFLAASDLVQNRADRADGWLQDAGSRVGVQLGAPLAFWSARLAEIRGDPDRAVRLYLELIADAPFDPFSQLARQRLASPTLEAAARTLGLRLATRSDPGLLFRAWLLLGESEEGTAARGRALEQLGRSSSAQAFLGLEFVAPDAWPLWEASLRKPDEMLAALGLWQQGLAATLRYFPISETSLAYTGSRLLSSAGAHRRALQQAETLYEGARSVLPEPFIPVPLRRASYPLPYGQEIAASAARHRIDPFLLTALIREESRFDADAVSHAAARGLTQFILPTARRLESRAGLDAISADDLHRPAISISLGAAYLDELLDRYDNREYQAISAYNAGENQAELWFSYCFSEDPAEFLTKVGFRETRNYVRKVATSWSQYRDLYPEETLSAD